MSVPCASAKTCNPVSFVVKRTFVELPGAEGEHVAELARRRSDIGPIRPAQDLECMSGLLRTSTCDDEDSDEEDINASARMVSFVSSVDSDDFIGAPPSNMSLEWSAAQALERESTCRSDDMKAEIPWAPCSSSASTVSSDSQTPWAACSSSDSTLSSASQLSWTPCSSNGSSYREAHFVPHDSANAEQCTTIMVRNIPNSLCQLDFVNELKQRGYNGLFDFLYLPMNLRENGSFGYAFVNFISPSVAVRFMRQLELLEHDAKEWRAEWSTCQGMVANIERYRNSPLMHNSVPAHCKPAMYDGRGMQVQFPAPTKNIPKPRIHHGKGKAVEKDSECRNMGARGHVVSRKSDRVWPSMSKMGANVAAHMMGQFRRVGNPR